MISTCICNIYGMYYFSITNGCVCLYVCTLVKNAIVNNV